MSLLAESEDCFIKQVFPQASPDPLPSSPIAFEIAMAQVPPAETELIHLEFNQLGTFEPVQEQFWEQGVRFEGAIALQPSNPAFQADNNSPSVMPITGRSNITVHFRQPRQTVGAVVTAPRQITVTAFDQNDNLLGQQRAGSPKYLQQKAGQAEIFPRHHLELLAQGAVKVVLSSTAPFILQEFFYG
jgi:hypothetical protein